MTQEAFGIEPAATPEEASNQRRVSPENAVSESPAVEEPVTQPQEQVPEAAPVEEEVQGELGFLDRLEAEARAEIEELKSGGAIGANKPIGIAANYVTIGAVKIAKGAVKFEQWSAEMLKVFKDLTDKQLRAIYARSKKAAKSVNLGEAPFKDAVNKEAKKLPRKFLTRVLSGDIPDGLREKLEAIDPQDYKQNPTTAEYQSVKEWMDASPENVSSAERVVYDETTPMSARKGVLGVALLNKYRATNNADAESSLTEYMDRQFREAGRFIQAASLWGQMSSRGWERGFDKWLSKQGRDLNPDVKRDIRRRLREAAAIPEGDARNAALAEAVEYATSFVPPRFGDWLDAYRYSNMLSSPGTWARNSVYNVFNALITRPLSLSAQGHPVQAARYEVEAIRALPQAAADFMQAMRDIDPSNKHIDAGPKGAFDDAQNKQLPGALTVVGRFMYAQDRFVAAMISAGEASRLIRSGLNPETANDRATALAQEYLLRNRVGEDMKNKHASTMVRALDALGYWFMQGRRLPVMGRPMGWFVPFVQTTIEWGKMGVKASPLSYIRPHLENGKVKQDAMTQEEKGLARVGTSVMLMGAVMAAAGRTTWGPPRDRDEKELFYKSGRKPYSVLIGDAWIPMWYFGPFAFALAIPAAVRDAAKDDPAMAGKGWVGKMGRVAQGLAQFYTSQTPMQSVNGFLKVASGDTDWGTPRTLGFTAGQLIPASGFVRWVNGFIDPTYRSANSFFDTMKRDLPVLSKQVKPYTDPDGEPAKKTLLDTLPPFPIGKQDEEYEALFQGRKSTLMSRQENNVQLDQLVEQHQKGLVDVGEIRVFIYSQDKGEQSRLKSRMKSKHGDVDVTKSSTTAFDAPITF